MAIQAAALLGAQAGGSLLSGFLEKEAGEQEARRFEFQAEQESINAVIRDNARQARLLDAIASQNVAAAAGGVAAFSGSPLTILQEDIKKASREATVDFRNAKVQELSFRASAAGRRRLGQLRAFGSLLGAGADIAKTGIGSPGG